VPDHEITQGFPKSLSIFSDLGSLLIVFLCVCDHSLEVTFETRQVRELMPVQLGFDGVKCNGHLDNLVVVGKLPLVGKSKEIRRNESATREGQSLFDVYREYACESADRMQGIKEASGEEDSAQDCKSVPIHAAGGNDRVVAKE
jgi:hypothetical protein